MNVNWEPETIIKKVRSKFLSFKCPEIVKRSCASVLVLSVMLSICYIVILSFCLCIFVFFGVLDTQPTFTSGLGNLTRYRAARAAKNSHK